MENAELISGTSVQEHASGCSVCKIQ